LRNPVVTTYVRVKRTDRTIPNGTCETRIYRSAETPEPRRTA
jgi:hypothetical protein